jgi:hypothetical protein
VVRKHQKELIAVDFIEGYIRLGFQVIPIHPRSKVPVGKGWNEEWKKEKAIAVFRTNDDFNVGLLLGNIVDVEADSQEAEDRLWELIGDIPHPAYKSKSFTHHLFLNPWPELTRIAFDGIEFRANRHQSLIPPSIHPDGPTYRWLSSDWIKQGIPQLPSSLCEIGQPKLKEQKRTNFRKRRKKSGFLRPWCSICEKRSSLHKSKFELEKNLFAELGYGWVCRRCRRKRGIEIK